MNIKNQSKSKLAWPVCTENEVKAKKVQEQWLQLKWSFYCFIIRKLLFSEGLTIGDDKGWGKWANFKFNVFSENLFKCYLWLCI